MILSFSCALRNICSFVMAVLPTTCQIYFVGMTVFNLSKLEIGAEDCFEICYVQSAWILEHNFEISTSF